MRRIIWCNDHLDLDDWQDFLEENYPDVTDESEKFRLIAEMNDEYLEDEKANLNVKLPRKILAVIDIGRWDGRSKAIVELRPNVNEIFKLTNRDCDYYSWYVEDGDAKCEMMHHDGTHFLTYRMWKPDVDEDTRESILEGETELDLEKHTESIAPYIEKVYGWAS